MPKSCKCILDHLKYKGAITEKEYDKLLRNLKGIEWHPYPQEKPSDGYYNVTLKYSKCTATAYYNTENDEWHGGNGFGFYVPNRCITAWAELPKPYEEGEEQ